MAGCADAFDLMHTAKNYETAGLQVEKCFTAHIFERCQQYGTMAHCLAQIGEET